MNSIRNLISVMGSALTAARAPKRSIGGEDLDGLLTERSIQSLMYNYQPLPRA